MTYYVEYTSDGKTLVKGPSSVSTMPGVTELKTVCVCGDKHDASRITKMLNRKGEDRVFVDRGTVEQIVRQLDERQPGEPEYMQIGAGSITHHEFSRALKDAR